MVKTETITWHIMSQYHVYTVVVLEFEDGVLDFMAVYVLNVTPDSNVASMTPIIEYYKGFYDDPVTGEHKHGFNARVYLDCCAATLPEPLADAAFSMVVEMLREGRLIGEFHSSQ